MSIRSLHYNKNVFTISSDSGAPKHTLNELETMVIHEATVHYYSTELLQTSQFISVSSINLPLVATEHQQVWPPSIARYEKARGALSSRRHLRDAGYTS